jgi:uncharacterized membrane protein YbhN (UPF0104 family)
MSKMTLWPIRTHPVRTETARSGYRKIVTRKRRRSSLIAAWLEQGPHPLVALAVVLVLEAAAFGGLVWLGGWRALWHAVTVGNAVWFTVCIAGQLVAYGGYTLALRSVASVDADVPLDLAASLGIVSVGFSPVFSATAGGGFSIDLAALREAGMTRRNALNRTLALGALEYAVLAPTVALCGLLLFFGVGGRASADLALPWLAVVPGALAAAWLTAPARASRFRPRSGDGRLRNGLAYTVSALTLLRKLLLCPNVHSTAFAGAALYWAGDMTTLWAALRVFDVHISAPALVLAYGTGWALTRRSLPLGGPGLVELLLAYVLTWFHVSFADAAAAVVAYRLFNFWLALLPAAAIIPLSDRIEHRLTHTRQRQASGSPAPTTTQQDRHR